MTPRTLVSVACGGFLGLAGLFAADRQLAVEPVPDVAVAREALWKDRFPDVLLQTHDGRTVRFGEDLIAGKTVAINFMYVACTEF